MLRLARARLPGRMVSHDRAFPPYPAAAPACSAAGGQPAGVASPVAPSPSSAATTLVVPAGESGGALSVPHTLTLPAGWTARVWARVPDARMEAWTPQGDLLVSQPNRGAVLALPPDAAGTATVTPPLAALTNPQGLAFATVNGRPVLYVAESDQVDAYPWGPTGISGARTVIAAGLPDLDPGGDDVHRLKDVTVAADGTVYFNVGSSSNANPDDRTMMPQRADIMSVRPDGPGLQVVEQGVRNGEGLAVAPDGTVWLAENGRDNIPYPVHGPYGQYRDAFGKVIRAYVNNHPRDAPSAARPAPRTRTTTPRRGPWPISRSSPTRSPTRAARRLTARRCRAS